MECKLTITGSFSELQRALSLLQGGPHLEAILETFPPIPMDRVIKPTKPGKAVKPEVKVPFPDTHCQSCGIMFTPKRKGTRFCSKKCNMVDYYDRHNKPVESPNANVAEPEAAAAPVKEPKPGRATVKGCKSKFKKEKKPLVKDDFGGLY